MKDRLNSVTGAAAGLVARPGADDELSVHGRYFVECRDADGNLKWTESFDNLVTTVGRNDMLDKYLSGSAWSTGTVYMGLKGAGTPVAGDTMASHATWTELNISASAGARQSVAFAAASAGAKATSAASSFTISAAGPTTVAGVFLVIGGSATNNNTTGVLFSAGDFALSRAVITADVLNITYSVSV